MIYLIFHLKLNHCCHPHLIISNNVREVLCWIHELHIFLMHIKSINYENSKSWFVRHLKSSCLPPSPTLWGNLSLGYRSDTSTWPTRPSGTCWCFPLQSLSLSLFFFTTSCTHSFWTTGSRSLNTLSNLWPRTQYCRLLPLPWTLPEPPPHLLLGLSLNVTLGKLSWHGTGVPCLSLSENVSP